MRLWAVWNGRPAAAMNFSIRFLKMKIYTVTAMSELLDFLNSMIAMMSVVLGGIAGNSLGGVIDYPGMCSDR